MSRYRAILLICVLCGASSLAGCDVFSPPSSAAPSAPTGGFLGISISDFSEARAIPVYVDTVTAQSTDVIFPEDLFGAVPPEAIMVLPGPSVAIADDGAGEAGQVNPSVEGAERRAAILFRVAPHEADACASSIQIGPFEATVVDGVVRLSNKSLPLTAAAQSVVRTSRFGICAQVWGDFDGSVVVGQITLEFGSLREHESTVELCHIPPGNPDNRHTITVGASAVEGHLAHGGYLGECRDSVAELTLTSVCSDDPDTERRWRIDNPNGFDMQVAWEVSQTDQAGTLTAPPGESYLLSDTLEGANPATITWQDEIGVQHSETEDSSSDRCETDADSDGVPDYVDACLGTPAAEEVNSAGCSCSQLDADTDGVNDCSDACPSTPAGGGVDGNGCAANQLDDDNDGVPNDVDTCPSTPAGEGVDQAGCGCSQLDQDGDGVSNCDDACPDTPQATDVDTDGCAFDSLDDDNDGVPDDADTCPDTPSGEAVDDSGCSCSQLDGDGDGVTDCDDLCPNTPVDVAVDGFGCRVAVVDAGSDVTLDEAGVVALQASASGGTPPYTYFWSAPDWEGGVGQNATVLVTQTTTYTLTVTDWSFPPQTATDTVTVTIRPHDGLQYTIINLGSPSSNSSYPSGINNLGEVVGYFFTDSWQKRAFMYSEGTMIDLGTLGGSEAWAYDINDAGQVVGEARTADGDWHAFLWDSSNGMRDLDTLGGTTSVAYAINELGQVVGYSSVNSVNHAFLYSDGVMSDLGTFDYYQSGAFDINDQSQIVGLLLPLTSAASAFIYQNGTLTDLGSSLPTGSEAWVINNSGLVAGHFWGSGVYQSFLYASGIAIDLGTLEGFANTYVWGLSDTGQLVGSVTNESGNLSHAFVYTGGELHDLNDLLVADHGWDYLAKTNAVNNSGQIAGYGRIGNQYRGFLLTPVP